MTTETIISLTAESLYQLIGGIAGIAVAVTVWLTWRIAKLSERIDNTSKNGDSLDKRIVFIEQLKMQESQQIAQNLIVELRNSIGKGKATKDKEGELDNK